MDTADGILQSEDTRPGKRRKGVTTAVYARVSLPRSPAPCTGQRRAELMDCYVTLLERRNALVDGGAAYSQDAHRLGRVLAMLAFRMGR